MSKTGRTLRIVCVVLAILFLAGAVVVLTDAVGADDPEQTARLAALAPVLAIGSVMWMLGALVATAAAAAGAVGKPRRDVVVMSPPNQQPQVQEPQFVAQQPPPYTAQPAPPPQR